MSGYPCIPFLPMDAQGENKKPSLSVVWFCEKIAWSKGYVVSFPRVISANADSPLYRAPSFHPPSLNQILAAWIKQHLFCTLLAEFLCKNNES